MVTGLDEGHYRLMESVTLKAARANTTVLRTGTTWRHVGNIEQGKVFSTKDQVVTVNSFNVYEADIVTHESMIVGYLLKAGQAFVAVEPVAVKFNAY